MCKRVDGGAHLRLRLVGAVPASATRVPLGKLPILSHSRS
jgi:hypothetical protein